MKIKWIVLLFMTALSGLVPGAAMYGLSLEDLVSLKQADALIAGEKLTLVQSQDTQPQLIPKNEVLRRLIGNICRDLEPSITVETLHIYKKPLQAEGNAWSAGEEAELYNRTLALSTLAGLQYFSASRGVMRTFYETSSVIDGPSTKKPLPDPVFSRLQSELKLYARQKDLTFGDNIYQYNFFTAPGAIIFIQENLTALTAGIIPAAGKNKLRSVVGILDAGDYILIYAASYAKAASFPGMKERIGTSFANRAEAVIHWFSDQADKAFRKN